MSNAGKGRPLTLVKRLAPYLIAVVALGWVLRVTDLGALGAALRHAPMALFIAVSAVMLVANLAADTFAMASVFSWFGSRVPYGDLFFVRGSTYLLAIVNYHVGQAAIVGYLYRARKVPFFRATGWILFIIGVNVGTLFLLASVGASRASGDLAMLRTIPLACGIGVVVYAGLLTLKPRLLAERSLFAPLFEMGIVGHLKGVLVRLPHVGVLLVWHFLSLRMFDIAVSPLTALLYLPAYFAVSSLPINVNGLGVAQLVAIAFFSPFAVVPAGAANPAALQKAAVIAYSLSTCGVSIVLQLCIGFACLRRGVALGMPEAEAALAVEREAEEAAIPKAAAAP
jgi:hypothetical protein